MPHSGMGVAGWRGCVCVQRRRWLPCLLAYKTELKRYYAVLHSLMLPPVLLLLNRLK